MAGVFLRSGRVVWLTASRVTSMFNSLAEDVGEAVSLDLVDRGGAVFIRRDGGGSEEVPLSAVLAEMAEVARQIEEDVAEVAADAARFAAAEG